MSDVCSYIQAHAGDGCWSLAQRCGISQQDLTSYNPAPNFCNNILADQYVCCSEGSLPDFSPKPDDDGNCYVYVIKQDDTCLDIAKANKMDADKIPDYNNLTWGWTGCNMLQRGQKICLSEGMPPFPSPADGVNCGPQVRSFPSPSPIYCYGTEAQMPLPLRNPEQRSRTTVRHGTGRN